MEHDSHQDVGGLPSITERRLILVDATPMQSDHRVRGVGEYVRNLCTHLARLDPDGVRFLAARKPSELLPDSVLENSFRARRGHRPAQGYWLYNEYFLRYALRREAPKVFHATDFNGVVRSARVCTVATLHDLTPLRTKSDDVSLSTLASKVRWHIYFHSKIKRAHHVIAISEYTRREAMRILGIPGERITTIPLGVDTNRFHPAPPPTGKPYFLFLGGRQPQKNLDRILQAFAKSRQTEAELRVAGSWSQVDQDWLDARCAGLGISGKVHQVGFVGAEVLPSVYAGALALLMPSLDEGFGLPVLESMASGTAVITSNRSVLPEVAGDAAMLVDPTDVDALASSMRRIVEEPDLRSTLVREGMNRARNFTWELTARRTLEVYEFLRS